MVPMYYKFGKNEHLEQLKNGLLYCNSLQYFRDLENDIQRKDEHEGSLTILKPKLVPGFKTTFEYSGGTIDVPAEEIIKIVIDQNESPSHLFCFSVLKAEENQEYEVSNIFNSDSVIVFDSVFINNVIRSLQVSNIILSTKEVVYKNCDEQTVYEKKWWEKDSRYKIQKEVRIALWKNQKNTPFEAKFTPSGKAEVFKAGDGFFVNFTVNFPN